MRVLITGASGYLGSRLLSKINKKKYSVFGVSLNGKGITKSYNLTSVVSITKMIRRSNPDCIIHCAGFVPTEQSGYKDSKKNMSNEIMTRNLLELTSCPVLYISSMTVYGGSHSGPFNEYLACFPETAYAQSKLDGERIIKGDGRGGFAVRIPVLFGLPRRSGLVHNLLMAAKNKADFYFPDTPILWSGMHVEDAADAILNLLPKINGRFTEVNVGYSGKLSLTTLVDTVNESYRTDIRVELEYPYFEFDLSRYKNLTSAALPNFRDSIEKAGAEIDK